MIRLLFPSFPFSPDCLLREKEETKAERLLEKLEDNEPVKELATNPLLLTLLCLVFGERNDFPPKQSELYKEGLEVLMKKWDAKRNIEREQIYKLLSPQNKEAMLGQIAFNTFVKEEYFFRQVDLQQQIKDYIRNLPEASADPEALRVDSEVVLKAIEHHHGLLVERAREIYSFSHLTFQEYFTAREIERERQLEILVQNITNPRWKEVFYLTAEMLRRSDDLLLLMKARIDLMLAGDEKLQDFLDWTREKANSIKSNYSTIFGRAFYGFLICNLDSFVNVQGYVDDPELNLDLNLVLNLKLALNLCMLKQGGDRSFDIAFNIGLLNRLEPSFVFRIYYSEQDTINLNPTLVCATVHDPKSPELLELLRPLKEKLPDYDFTHEFHNWWETCGEVWTHELQKICIEHRNIGHDWQFTDEQSKLLEQYYDANLLLVQCMNRSYVSKEVREEIESTLLLPIKALPAKPSV